jgi:hypothetical protein
MLQPLIGESLSLNTASQDPGARLDIVAKGLWGNPGQKTFFDIRVFNSLAPSYRDVPLSSCYRKNEVEKKRKYDQRIRDVELGCFSPLIFSTSGGLGPTATIVFKNLATRIAEKSNKHYSTIMNYIRCRLSFSLIRSTIRCL